MVRFITFIKEDRSTVDKFTEDKAALLMKERCIDFIQNPPENWDGAITYHTK